MALRCPRCIWSKATSPTSSASATALANPRKARAAILSIISCSSRLRRRASAFSWPPATPVRPSAMAINLSKPEVMRPTASPRPGTAWPWAAPSSMKPAAATGPRTTAPRSSRPRRTFPNCRGTKRAVPMKILPTTPDSPRRNRTVYTLRSGTGCRTIAWRVCGLAQAVRARTTCNHRGRQDRAYRIPTPPFRAATGLTSTLPIPTPTAPPVPGTRLFRL